MSHSSFVSYLEKRTASELEKSHNIVNSAISKGSPSLLCRIMDKLLLDSIPFEKNALQRLLPAFQALLKSNLCAVSANERPENLPKTDENLQHLIDEMISISCAELLNENGELWPRIIKIFALKETPWQQKEITPRLASSFISAIIIETLVQHWRQQDPYKNEISAEISGESLSDKEIEFYINLKLGFALKCINGVLEESANRLLTAKIRDYALTRNICKDIEAFLAEEKKTIQSALKNMQVLATSYFESEPILAILYDKNPAPWINRNVQSIEKCYAALSRKYNQHMKFLQIKSQSMTQRINLDPNQLLKEINAERILIAENTRQLLELADEISQLIEPVIKIKKSALPVHKDIYADLCSLAHKLLQIDANNRIKAVVSVIDADAKQALSVDMKIKNVLDAYQKEINAEKKSYFHGFRLFQVPETVRTFYEIIESLQAIFKINPYDLSKLQSQNLNNKFVKLKDDGVLVSCRM